MNETPEFLENADEPVIAAVVEDDELDELAGGDPGQPAYPPYI